MSAKSPGSKAWLEGAYDLTSPDDNRAYYQEFAKAYDAEFADALGYCYPRIIAEAYLAAAKPDDTPVADIGCGTGLVAEALPPDTAIDGFDISPRMLDAARAKGLYRTLYEADITGDLAGFGAKYGAVLSAGTFTHGHLGPEPFKGLLALARPGGLFVIGVNQAHFDALGFGAVLNRMVAEGLISEPTLKETRIYDQDGHAHASDLALVLTYHRLPEGR